MSVGAALAKVEKFRKYMLKYDNMIDVSETRRTPSRLPFAYHFYDSNCSAQQDRVPLQRWNKIVKQLLIAR